MSYSRSFVQSQTIPPITPCPCEATAKLTVFVLEGSAFFAGCRKSSTIRWPQLSNGPSEVLFKTVVGNLYSWSSGDK
jgi:hypothetical protein